MACSSCGLLKGVSLAVVVGSRALVTACKSGFKQLVGAEHLLQVISQKETPVRKLLFSPFASLPSQTNTGLQRNFLPDSSRCGAFRAKGPSLLSASQQPQALHFLFSPSRRGSAREKVWHKEDNECHLFWSKGDNSHESLSC